VCSSDLPEAKTDYPWVYSYGEQGEEDLKRLRVGAEIMVDGFLRVRSVNRHAVCGQQFDENGKAMVYPDGTPILMTDDDGDLIGCGITYDWKDRVMELVPYATEYLNGYYSDEDLAEKEKEERRMALIGSGLAIPVDEDDADEEY